VKKGSAEKGSVEKVAAVLSCVAVWALIAPLALEAQQRGEPDKEPQVEIVQTVGCVERQGDPTSWLLTAATKSEVTKRGVFNELEVEEARSASPGKSEFQLIGIADFLDTPSLLKSGERASFTTAEQANATGELREGRTVLVKGLLIEAEPVPRINLLAVVSLAETCR
jgi:hypothetical protein